MFSVPTVVLLQAEDFFLKMTNQEQLMMFKRYFFDLDSYTFSAFLPHSSDNTQDSQTLHLPQGAPHLDVEVQLPEHRIQVSGLRELSFESKMCWKLLANGEQGPPRKYIQ